MRSLGDVLHGRSEKGLASEIGEQRVIVLQWRLQDAILDLVSRRGLNASHIRVCRKVLLVVSSGSVIA